MKFSILFTKSIKIPLKIFSFSEKTEFSQYKVIKLYFLFFQFSSNMKNNKQFQGTSWSKEQANKQQQKAKIKKREKILVVYLVRHKLRLCLLNKKKPKKKKLFHLQNEKQITNKTFANAVAWKERKMIIKEKNPCLKCLSKESQQIFVSTPVIDPKWWGKNHPTVIISCTSLRFRSI